MKCGCRCVCTQGPAKQHEAASPRPAGHAAVWQREECFVRRADDEGVGVWQVQAGRWHTDLECIGAAAGCAQVSMAEGPRAPRGLNFATPMANPVAYLANEDHGLQKKEREKEDVSSCPPSILPGSQNSTSSLSTIPSRRRRSLSDILSPGLVWCTNSHSSACTRQPCIVGRIRATPTRLQTSTVRSTRPLPPSPITTIRAKTRFSSCGPRRPLRLRTSSNAHRRTLVRAVPMPSPLPGPFSLEKTQGLRGARPRTRPRTVNRVMMPLLLLQSLPRRSYSQTHPLRLRAVRRAVLVRDPEARLFRLGQSHLGTRPRTLVSVFGTTAVGPPWRTSIRLTRTARMSPPCP